MKAGLDSATPPTSQQAAMMHAGGVDIYGGYLPMAGAYHGWTAAEFAAAREVGSLIAYAFPVSVPRAARAAADALGARLVLDNARGDTADPFAASIAAWMAAAGTPGMYGQPDVLAHWRGHYSSAVAATRPAGDPRTNDPGLGLGVPTGNQWQGGHQEDGLDVDRGWYDDSFASSAPPAPPAPLPGPIPPPPPHLDAVTVHAGDTLSGIAAAHGVSLAALEAWNPQLERPPHAWGLIFPGDLVRFAPGAVPTPAPPAPTPGAVPAAPTPGRYVVRRGDTFSAIAYAHHVNLAALERANPQLQRGGHQWGLIFPGDLVTIP